MILASLVRYYRRLATETDETGNPKVPSYGFSEEKIGWILVLDKEGRLKTVVPNLTADKKPQPKLMSVPRPEKRTSGIKPNFLWDKTALYDALYQRGALLFLTFPFDSQVKGAFLCQQQM
ncbi:phage associated protein [Neisseria gonorrhoeae]|nr:phage associated protein [Neisseria gonorrhoeae]